jgi:hypothetical protein
MFDSLVVDVAIGLVFTFAVFAALTSLVTEGISRFLGLRGTYLVAGLRALVDSDGHQASNQLLGTGLLSSQGMVGVLTTPPVRLQEMTLKAKRALPSYIPARSFGAAVMTLLVPDPVGRTTFSQLLARVNDLPDGVLRSSLLSLAAATDGDLTAFRSSVEAWYADHMDRVSGWYKRRVRWFSLGVGIVLVLVCNVSAISLSRALYTDQALRESVVTQAVASSDCAKLGPDECLTRTREAVGSLRGLGLPFGWGTVPACQGTRCSVLERYGIVDKGADGGHQVLGLLLLLVGWAVTAVALLPGARFWFDILGKLGTLRSTGPKPASP